MSDSGSNKLRKSSKKANGLISSLLGNHSKTRQKSSGRDDRDEERPFLKKSSVRFPAPTSDSDEDDQSGQYGALPYLPSVPASMVGSKGRSVREDDGRVLQPNIKPSSSPRSRAEPEVMIHKSRAAKAADAAKEKASEKVGEKVREKLHVEAEKNDFSYAYDTAVKMAETSSSKSPTCPVHLFVLELMDSKPIADLATRLQSKLGPKHTEAETANHLASMLSTQLKWMETNQALLQGMPLDSLGES